MNACFKRRYVSHFLEPWSRLSFPVIDGLACNSQKGRVLIDPTVCASSPMTSPGTRQMDCHDITISTVYCFILTIFADFTSPSSKCMRRYKQGLLSPYKRYTILQLLIEITTITEATIAWPLVTSITFFNYRHPSALVPSARKKG